MIICWFEGKYMQKIITLVITAAILYTVVNNKVEQEYKAIINTKPSAAAATDGTTNQEIASSSAPEAEMEGNFLEKSLSKVLVNVLRTKEGRMFFESIIQPADQPMAGNGASFKVNNAQLIDGMFQIKTRGTGTVGPVSCGHIAVATYTITTLDDILVEEQTKTFHIGSDEVISGIENMVIGMYVGQIREGVIPPRYAYDNKKFQGENKLSGTPYKVKIVLRDIIPKTFIASDGVKIFDDEVAYQVPYLCGERAAFDVKITKIDGTVIYNTEEQGKKLEMKLGDLVYPMIFSHALFNKIPTGVRTVIVEGKYFRSLANQNSNKIFPKAQLAMKEFFLIEFKNFNQDGR
jgi:hypothetical protein